MTQKAAFKYTFPIAKAEQREDGAYIVGYASGPEVDTESERMDPEAIERFSAQINTASSGDALIYRDAHAQDGVLRDLGVITKAWINENFHLGVEVKLDTDNPAAVFLFKSILAGKQYGMSVSGFVLDYIDEFVASAGTVVRTYKNVVLDEISDTTRPAWYPSLGTVLSKSVKDASATTSEEDMSKTATAELDTKVEDATKSDDTKSADDTTQTTTEVAVVETTTTDDVDKSGKVSGKTGAKLLGLFTEMQATLAEIGLVEAPATTTDDDSSSAVKEETTEKTAEVASTEATVSKSDLDALSATLAKANERIAELEAAPRTQLPGIVSDATKKTEDEFAELMSKASPSEKIRLAFAARTGGK
jgi:phage head maturation protease